MLHIDLLRESPSQAVVVRSGHFFSLIHRCFPMKQDLVTREELIDLLQRQVLGFGVEEVD